MYARRRIVRLAWIVGTLAIVVLVLVVLGRLDFPGRILRGLAVLAPGGPSPAYTPEEIGELREKLSRLEGEYALLRERLLECQGDRRVETISAGLGHPTITAHVIYRDHARLFDTAIIDRGTSDGVEAEMPVVDSRGLVGRVVSTRSATSRVVLITSPDCAFGVIDQRSRDPGIVRGTESVRWALGAGEGGGRGSPAPDLLELLYLSPSADISVHDTLITSGLSGITPPGIRVGEVVEIINREEQGMYDIRVRPFADIDHLGTVAVVLFEEESRQEILELVEETGGELGSPAAE